MAKHSERKLFLFGRYSLAVLPPKRWLTELGIDAGDSVTMEFDKKRRRIVVRLPEKPNAGVTIPATERVAEKQSSDQSSDWQPIPQL